MCIRGDTAFLNTYSLIATYGTLITQLVEYETEKLWVASSSPVLGIGEMGHQSSQQ